MATTTDKPLDFIKYRQVPRELVGLVLQKIYDSEINLSLEPFWDSGWEINVGDSISDKPYINNLTEELKNYDTNTIENAVSVGALLVCGLYPESDFRKWFDEPNRIWNQKQHG